VEERHDERPSRDVLAAEAGLTPRRVDDLLPYLGDLASLDQPLDDAGETVLADVVADRSAEAPDEAVLRSALASQVERMLAVLDEQDREVLALRFGLDGGEPRSVAEVGVLVNLGRERVRQIEQRALARLRHPAAEVDIAELLAG
jgi:RNA polymerase sigma factor (sigma-70 family)